MDTVSSLVPGTHPRMRPLRSVGQLHQLWHRHALRSACFSAEICLAWPREEVGRESEQPVCLLDYAGRLNMLLWLHWGRVGVEVGMARVPQIIRASGLVLNYSRTCKTQDEASAEVGATLTSNCVKRAHVPTTCCKLVASDAMAGGLRKNN